MWASHTASPEPASQEVAAPGCDAADGALGRVAERIARRAANGEPDIDAAELAFELRRAGEPHVWPSAFVTSSAREAEALSELASFVGSLRKSGVRRCGIARLAAQDGTITLAAVTVDALADLSPLPTRARAGQWVTFSAALLVPASSAKLVVEGPLGAPRTVPTTLIDGHARASFAVDREGAWTAQLLAVVDGGPRPLLEATIFVERAPPATFVPVVAPGEGDGGSEDATSLFRMILAARSAFGLPSLSASAVLDEMARQHAEAMRSSGLLSHDTGDGDPLKRLSTRGVSARAAGENVAHERTLERAHRALWASPSHRANLLDTRYDSVGIGVARDADGTLWVCELFSDFRDTGIRQPFRGTIDGRAVEQ